MISWLANNASIVVLLFVLTSLASAFGWWVNRKLWYLLAMSALAVLAFGVWLLGLYHVTDQRRLTEVVEQMAAAIEARNVEGFFEHVSESFNHAAMSKAAFREYVDQRTKRHQVRRFSVSRFDFGEVSRTTRKGEIDFAIHAEGNWGETLPLRCFAEFVLEGDNWRLKGFRLKLGGTGQDFPLPTGRF